MNLTKETDGLSIYHDICLTSRMKIRSVVLRCVSDQLADSQFIKYGLDNTFEIKEIAFSVHSKCKHGSFIWKLGKWKRLRKIYISKLIKTNVFVSSVIVSCQGRKHSIQCTGTHNAVVLTKRIADGDHLTKYIIFWNSQFIKYLRALK